MGESEGSTSSVSISDKPIALQDWCASLGKPIQFDNDTATTKESKQEATDDKKIQGLIVRIFGRLTASICAQLIVGIEKRLMDHPTIQFKLAVFISSYGGDADPVGGVIDQVRLWKASKRIVRVVTVGQGMIASCAIYLAHGLGDPGFRFIQPLSTAIFHAMSMSVSSPLTPTLTLKAKTLVDISHIWNKVVLPTVSQDLLQRAESGTDIFMSATEYVQYGLADFVL